MKILDCDSVWWGAGGKVSGKDRPNSFTAHFSFGSPHFDIISAAFGPH